MNMQLKADGDFVYQTGETGKIVRVRVHYIKTQGTSRRGIYVSVEPWEIMPDTGTGYSGESTILGSDTSVFVERLARAKPSAVAQIAARLDAHAPAFASLMIREGRARTFQALQAFFTDGSVPVVSGAGLEPQPEPVKTPDGWSFI